MLFEHYVVDVMTCCLGLPEGLGVLTPYVQLWGRGGAGGVVVAQGRVLDKLRERNPAALHRYLGSCWTTAHNKNRGTT